MGKDEPQSALPTRGLLDTSVVIDFDILEQTGLPTESSVSTITLAELGAGPHATNDPDERARRQTRLQDVEASMQTIPFDAEASRAYAHLYALTLAAGRKARGPRALDLLIAATALSRGLPLYTLNPSDFAALTDVVQVVAVRKREPESQADDGENEVSGGRS